MRHHVPPNFQVIKNVFVVLIILHWNNFVLRLVKGVRFLIKF